jgi:hypothetical protein
VHEVVAVDGAGGDHLDLPGHDVHELVHLPVPRHPADQHRPPVRHDDHVSITRSAAAVAPRSTRTLYTDSNGRPRRTTGVGSGGGGCGVGAAARNLPPPPVALMLLPGRLGGGGVGIRTAGSARWSPPVAAEAEMAGIISRR